ncbi:expressed protein [Phakopsora pachyrhizi]|uniref:Expressed protein n=1 Tax=Phakopsora pachyrhizi TaxID=170000 RepID=A0AAV0B8J2_PHAPC|nr:expressed protein [Phakopsora pachyrhizi]
MTQQCQSYLSAINALSLVPEKHAWICVPCRKSTKPNSSGYLNQTESRASPSGSGIRKRRRINFFIPEKKFSSGTTDMEILTLADIRKSILWYYPDFNWQTNYLNSVTPDPLLLAQRTLMGDLGTHLCESGQSHRGHSRKQRWLETDMIPIFEKLAGELL